MSMDQVWLVGMAASVVPWCGLFYAYRDQYADRWGWVAAALIFTALWALSALALIAKRGAEWEQQRGIGR